MTQEDIQQYKDAVGKDWITLFGYTSTTVSENVALGFAWENEHSGHTKVLFHIKWDNWT